ncbi:protein CURVATURE THYLAKOID 1D, chloroplastic [Lotus japonicus]|uniref:protein CURVATURE THYLAKOID 1D, chloroplastic n=1 Tax=Lotus japonicus TaxID=34305 RepID=UPI00258318F3|nr:protein CURVATURE THYLAKOID 1D, chloroplastic [Lotus japonicus]
MGLTTLHPIPLSKLPTASTFLPKPFLPPRQQTLITPSAALLSRSIFVRNLLTRATSSDETSGSSSFYGEKRDGVVILDDVKGAGENGFSETVVSQDPKEEVPVDEQAFALLDDLNMKLDLNDTGSIVLYGSGAVVALWLLSAVIGAIDSIPLFPKLLEVVGLSYTVWFTTRYLLFKKNRDELGAKIEELKEQVIGSEDK